jgi:hypothetical protein
MKKLLPFALVLTLAACASNKDQPKIPSASGSGSKANAAGDKTPAVTPAPVTPADPTCPVLNGTYGKKNADGSVLSIVIATKVDGAVYSYAFDAEGKDFTAADGVQRDKTDADGQKGSIKMSCEKTTITEEAKAAPTQAQPNPAPFTMKYTVMSATQFQLDATGDAAALSGQYTKQ